jgi:hypothetical protein
VSEVSDPNVSNLDPNLKTILESNEEEDRDFIFCAQCSNVVSRASARVEVNGSHTHLCTNPYGLEFNVGCLENALGCDISGRPEAADTWFFGYQWHIASCASCQTHLGWYFTTSDHYFYGLILDRIQEDK